jgi:hypothetical protein
MQRGRSSVVGTRVAGCNNGNSLGEYVGRSKRVVSEDARCQSKGSSWSCAEMLADSLQRTRTRNAPIGMQLWELGKELCPDRSCAAPRGRGRALDRGQESTALSIANRGQQLQCVHDECCRGAGAPIHAGLRTVTLCAKTGPAATVGGLSQPTSWPSDV